MKRSRNTLKGHRFYVSISEEVEMRINVDENIYLATVKVVAHIALKNQPLSGTA